MKKSVLALLISLLGSAAIAAPAPTASAINLPGGGPVAPASDARVSLKPLLKDAIYNISCTVTNEQTEAVDMRFEPSFEYTSYGQVVLNEQFLENSQGSLQSGPNTVTFNNVSVSGMGEPALQFKNLDFKNAVTVSNCVAKPSIKMTALPTSGCFTMSNQTSHFVSVKVGNFFPSSYNIGPYGDRFVCESTSYLQDIKIAAIDAM